MIPTANLKLRLFTIYFVRNELRDGNGKRDKNLGQFMNGDLC